MKTVHGTFVIEVKVFPAIFGSKPATLPDSACEINRLSYGGRGKIVKGKGLPSGEDGCCTESSRREMYTQPAYGTIPLYCKRAWSSSVYVQERVAFRACRYGSEVRSMIYARDKEQASVLWLPAKGLFKRFSAVLGQNIHKVDILFHLWAFSMNMTVVRLHRTGFKSSLSCCSCVARA